MFEYIKGILINASPQYATVEKEGLGYRILIPLNAFAKLPTPGKEILFFLTLVIREDAHTLYGFLTRVERDLFEKLITISGIGPKTALALIGHMEASELKLAISQENAALICKIPGIGKKTAERLIIELRDRFKPEEVTDLQEGTLINDALNALIHLGYPHPRAQKAIQTALNTSKEELPLAKLITLALRQI